MSILRLSGRSVITLEPPVLFIPRHQPTNYNISDESVGLCIQIRRQIALRLVFGVIKFSA